MNYVPVRNQAMVMTYKKETHGFSVLRNVMKYDIDVYFADVFYDKGNSDQNVIVYDNSSALKALDWFHDHGVKVVSTTFVSSDPEIFKEFLSKAESYHMVVIVSSGNSPKLKQYYPMMNSGPVISIAAKQLTSVLFSDNMIATNTDYVLNGNVYDLEGNTVNCGSSFAVSRAIYPIAKFVEDTGITDVEVIKKELDINV